MRMSMQPECIHASARSRRLDSAEFVAVHNAHAAAASELLPLACMYVHTYAPETSVQPRRKDMSLSATCAAKYVRLNNKSPDSYPCQRVVSTVVDKDTILRRNQVSIL